MSNDLLEPYKQFASVFSKEEISKLPEHSPWDHEIKLTCQPEPTAVLNLTNRHKRSRRSQRNLASICR